MLVGRLTLVLPSHHSHHIRAPSFSTRAGDTHSTRAGDHPDPGDDEDENNPPLPRKGT